MYLLLKDLNYILEHKKFKYLLFFTESDNGGFALLLLILLIPSQL